MEHIVGEILKAGLPATLWPVILGGPLVIVTAVKTYNEYVDNANNRDPWPMLGWGAAALAMIVFTLFALAEHKKLCESYMGEDVFGSLRPPSFGTANHAAWEELECDKTAGQSAFP